MKRVILTGTRGFIGQHAIAPLLERGYEVHAVSQATLETLPGVTAHKVNLLQADEARDLVMRVHPTHLLHLAWDTEHGKFWTAPSNLDWVGASLVLLRAFHEMGGRRAVFAGTCAEYEWTDAVQSEGGTALRPATLYGVAKHSLHQTAAQFARQEGISFAWGRIFFLYGPKESPARLVPAVIRALLAGEPALLTHGQQVRDFMHTSDVARAFVETLDSDFVGALNVASGRGTRLADVARTIGELIGRPELVQLGAKQAPALDPHSIVADASILHERIGFRESIDLNRGLAETIGWWKVN